MSEEKNWNKNFDSGRFEQTTNGLPTTVKTGLNNDNKLKQD